MGHNFNVHWQFLTMTLSEEEYADSTDNKLLQEIKSKNWLKVKETLESEDGREMTKGS